MIALLQKLVSGRTYKRGSRSDDVLRGRSRFFHKFNDLLCGESAKKEGSMALIFFVVKDPGGYAEDKLLGIIREHLPVGQHFGVISPGRYGVMLTAMTNEAASGILTEIARGLRSVVTKQEHLSTGIKHASAPLPTANEFKESADANLRPFLGGRKPRSWPPVSLRDLLTVLLAVLKLKRGV